METTENANPTVPVNNTTENKTDTQEVQSSPAPAPTQPTGQAEPAQPAPGIEVQSQPATEVQPLPASEEKPTSNVEGENNTNTDAVTDNENDDTVKVNGNTVTIDAQPFVSELFSKNPGEIAKVFDMDPKQLKKEQNKLKKKGSVMDNKYANLFLLQSIRDECGILVMGCLASWLLTRIGFSIYWTIFVMAATLMSYITYNNRKKHLYYNKERKAYQQKVRLNSENPETLNWLNYILRKAWPTAEPLIGGIVMENVNGILDGIEIGLDSIKITEFSLGTEAPKLMEMCPSTDSDPNVIKFTCLAKYEPLDENKISKYDIESGEKRASKIVLGIKPSSIVPNIPTQVTNILFIGKLLFVITTMESFPYVRKVEFTFVEQPNISWDLKPLSAGIDIMKFGLDNAIDMIVKKIIAGIALEPTRITLEIKDMIESMTLDQPIGLLKLNFYEGKDLKNTSKLGGKDDPYAKFSINGNELARTKIIGNDLNPSWNHTEYVIVSGLIYADPKNNSDLAIIEVMSDNNLKKDNVMGRVENFYLRQYIALCEIENRKKLEIEREALFIENLNRQGITDEKEIARLRKEENKKRKKELAQREKNKSFAQNLLSSLEVSAEEYINSLNPVERKEYIDKWGDPLVESDTVLQLYQLGKDNEIDKTKPAGKIRMGISYIPLNVFNENFENDQSTEKFSETGIARIWIYKVQKLEKNPNPYCIAEIDGQEVLRTPKKKYNNNPGYNSFKDVFIKNFSTAKLTVTVKDSETGSDSVLGTFSWELIEIYERLKEDPGANWFKLSSKFEEAVINLGLEWKPMIMNMSSNIQKPIGVCRLLVKGAKNLKNNEKIGVADPYSRIYLSGKEIAVTDIVENSLNPDFNEVYYLMIRSKNDRLGFDIFDHSEMKNDQKLGKVEMNITDICRNIKINGETVPITDSWNAMEKLMQNQNLQNGDVSAPLYDKQNEGKVRQGNIEFNLKFFEIVDLGLNNNETEKDKQEDTAAQNNLASENTDRTFVNKVKDSNLLSGIIRVKIYSVSDLPKAAFYNIDSYFEDEPFNVLLSTPRTPKPSTGGNVEAIVEGFVRNYQNTKMVFGINDKNGSTVKRLATLSIPIEQLITGKLGIDVPFIHICDNGTTKIKLGVEYEPLNMQLERGELSPEMGTLKVHIAKGTVKGVDSSGTSDPYVKVIFRGESVYKTGEIKKTLTPEWNENFSLDISDRKSNKLVFQVYDWNKVQKDELIGQGVVPLYSIYDKEKVSKTISIYNHNKKGDIESEEAGTLDLDFEFIPSLHNKRMRNRIGNNNAALKLAGGVAGGVASGVGSVAGGVASGVGSVAGGVVGGVASGVGSVARGIGLKKSNKSTGGSTIKIKIIKAEGLKAVDSSGTSDPYVKIEYQKKAIYKTKIIKKNTSPVWNEECSMKFDRESSEPVVFTLKDNNVIGKSTPLGFVEVNINEVLFNAGEVSINRDFDVQNGPGKLTLQIDCDESATTPTNVEN
ncbi:hypothetical protein H8356DRAFT_1088025 [Neocallimastix lanati (nom. inval.)]|jgi:Ca2+-dependent lipid-binding protein|uniref:Tricalbin n=1 Tax=Neocallimastix californiae TaxID=1754190 RepID=A0A1Y2DRH7_9FUNG|nr:hypothetical protein H8356DRAFT_1088025 [Neocallimastix sp. JGI-2020a]ORY61888.1 hypothetical protein LY90DRAFT_505605 [Neocallimastix californiae]|eukprot:ORY61888.1 hypothetical protein LY90DRAFT_505605 [Neocallimastix californiae]